ncbi:MAG TPA: hypothetical protein VFB06_34660 [Streptosporangiaceae bacterium]|nr:hypothetical protein [Streptosporangiaceae bacterium]
MNAHDDVMCQVRDSFSGLRMDMPVETVFARGRVRRRRRLSGLTAVTAATAAAATAMTLSLGGPAPARSGNPPPPSTGPVRLAAFSVTSGPGESTTLTLYKGPQYPRLDPGALRQALARHGIPALVTVGTFCRSRPGVPGFDKVVNASRTADGSAMVINGQAMPPGTRLSIGLFPGYTRMLLINDDAPLSCGSTSRQPAAHTTPSGTAIRGSHNQH